MDSQQEIEELRHLAELHCSWCVDCCYDLIPRTGLLETWQDIEDPETPGEFIHCNENASCPFARYWDKLATDELFRGSPCHCCPEVNVCTAHDCDKYMQWLEGMEPWERRRCADRWMNNVNATMPSNPRWECGLKGWSRQRLKEIKECSTKKTE